MEATQRRRSYNVGEAKQLTCAHCGKRFRLDNPTANDDAHAYITGGLIEAVGCDNEELVYHGYLRQNDNCFYQSTQGDLYLRIDSDYRDELNEQITDVVQKWFKRYGPRGCKLSKIKYQLDMTYAIPDARVTEHDRSLVGEQEDSNVKKNGRTP